MLSSHSRCASARSIGVVGLAILAAGTTASAGELFRDQMTNGAGWGANTTSGDTAATFNYNYAADFIPEAPNSAVGDASRRGLKFEANISAPPTSESLSVYPVGENFTGTYRLRFDMWCNYDVDEHINGASNATTEFMGGGIGYDNITTDIGSGYQMIVTGDGGSGSDYRAFADGTFLAPEDMEAGTRNGFDAYYSDFLPGVAPPAGQAQGAFPPGSAGSPAFQWVTMEFIAFGGKVHVSLEKPNGDRRKIVVFDTADYPGVSTDGNISLFYADLFSSITPRPDLTFGIIDNVVVDDVPAPGTALVVGTIGCLGLRRRRQ